MSFTDDETGEDSSAPIELYEFNLGSVTYYYTSGPETYTFGGNDYTAIPIQRDAPKLIRIREKSKLTISVPVGQSIVSEFTDVPPQDCSVIVTRVQEDTGNYKVIFRGKVLRMKLKNRLAQFSCLPDMAKAMDTSFPPKVFSRFCNHQLFDGRCQLDKDDFAYTTTVLSVTGNVIVLATDAGNPDSPQNKGPVQRYSGGEMLHVASGESRRIVRSGDYTTTGAYPGVPSSSTLARTHYLSMPFRSINAGDSVTIYEGCSKSAAECKTKFNNLARFGGYPLVPVRNIYTATNGVKGVD